MTGEKVSDVLRGLIREQLSELGRERVLIDALAERWTRLTIDLSWGDGEPLPKVISAEPRSPDAPPLREICEVAARGRGAQVAIELVGRGSYEDCRVMLVVAPAGRSVRFEVVPAELTPAMEQAT